MIKQYLITDPSHYSSNPATFKEKLSQTLFTCKPDFICLRDKESSDYRALAYAFTDLLKGRDIKLVLHSDCILAKELGCFGVHLPSNRFDDIQKAKSTGLHVIVSTHTLEEAKKAEALGADFITYSPIFDTPNKGKPKGLEKLKEINDKININCFALGGILNKEQIEACEKAGAYGFASIRYFIR